MSLLVVFFFFRSLSDTVMRETPCEAQFYILQWHSIWCWFGMCVHATSVSLFFWWCSTSCCWWCRWWWLVGQQAHKLNVNQWSPHRHTRPHPDISLCAKKINKWRAFCIITLVFCFILERHHSLLVMTYIFDMTIHMSPPNIHISFTFSHSNFAFFSSYFHFVYFNITFHVWRCAVLHFIIMLCMSIELYYMLCIYEDDQKWWNCIFRTHEKAREIKTRNKTNGK